MKHINRITKEVPVNAAAWQDVLCDVIETVASLLSAKGGSLPFLTFIDSKCQPVIVDPPT